MEYSWRNALTEAFIEGGLGVEFKRRQKYNTATTIEGIGGNQLVEHFLVSTASSVGWVFPPRLHEVTAPITVPHDHGACICQRQILGCCGVIAYN
eukprot:1827304-Pyramimonas_sp.AAC.1